MNPKSLLKYDLFTQFKHFGFLPVAELKCIRCLLSQAPKIPSKHIHICLPTYLANYPWKLVNGTDHVLVEVNYN